MVKTTTKSIKPVKKISKKVDTKELKVSKKWEDAPNVIEQNGVPYEKVYESTVNVKLDLDDNVLKMIRIKAKAGMYSSDGEIIRDALKSMILVNKKD